MHSRPPHGPFPWLGHQQVPRPLRLLVLHVGHRTNPSSDDSTRCRTNGACGWRHGPRETSASPLDLAIPATPPPSSPTPLGLLASLPFGQPLGDLRLVPAVGRLVVRLVHPQVVLGHVPARPLVGVLVALPVPELLRPAVAGVPQVLRDRDRPPLLHVL